MQVIQLLGTFQVGRGATARCAGIGEIGRECAAHFFQNLNRMFDRTDLVEKFWATDDPFSGKAALNSVLSRLRRTLHATQGLEIEVRSDKWSVGVFTEAKDTSDTAILAQIYRDLKRGDVDVEVAGQSLQRLYRGNFLPGHSSSWTMIERERLQAMFVRSALRVTDHLMRKADYDESIDHCRFILTHDPLREAVHRRIMLIRAIKGENSKLRRDFARLVEFAKVECDATPFERTQGLYAALCANPSLPELEALIAQELALA